MISFFVPVFNEVKVLGKSLKALDKEAGKIPFQHEIFLVNDASTDGTALLAEDICRRSSHIHLLNYSDGPSRRENLAASFKQAHGNIVVFLDIDLMATLRYLLPLIEGVVSGSDIVIGSRYVPGSKIRRKPFRLFTSLLFNFCVRILFRGNLHDYLCGFKAFKKEVILDLVEEMGFDETFHRGIFWDAELLLRAARKEYVIQEIPIVWRERKKTALSFRREIKSLPYIFQFWSRFKKKENS